MCQNCVPTAADPGSDAFAERMIEMINAAALAPMISIGHRTGLFDAMDGLGPKTSVEIAEAAALVERYVREWLGAMVTGRIVEFDPETRTYDLPEAHARWLCRRGKLENIASTMQWFSVLGQVEDDIVACFRNGGGVPYERFARFHDVMAEESDQTTVGGIDGGMLDLDPALRGRLEAGIDVLDIGCGRGHALIELAVRFPNSRFRGYDFNPSAIGHARETASRRGVTNVEFMVQDVAALPDVDAFDLVTAFDAVHDQADPAAVLRNVRTALRADGRFLMQDIAGSSHVEKNLDMPLAPMVYTISCMHCMTVSLAQGGAGLGAAWGEEKAAEMLEAAGFEVMTKASLEHDIMNTYVIAR